ncbi:Rad2 nuclease [Xylographa opegraphella]|nr:Rad2 nuclease [Xylographa opegraphella]
MGISGSLRVTVISFSNLWLGLLPLLKSIHKPCNLKKFKGLTIGVDAYGWLHRGTVACAIDLALEKPTTKFVDFAMHRVRMLIHFGITPYIIFDGDYLPSKASTEVARAKKRAESKRVGLELYRIGKPSQAHLELQKAVDVTPEMARQLIEELKRHKIKYVVAPYEADAQLVYLEGKDIIQGIISEDSDMLVFGAKRLLTKLDQYGDCIEINRADFTACTEISLVGWSDSEFRKMAILSGCDYLANINKMGLKTAYRLVRKYRTIEKILRIIQLDGQYRVPPEYLENFRRAELTFLHQRVFCPHQEKLVLSTELAAGLQPEDLAFIGKDVEADIALGVARGDLHPMTKEPITVRTEAKSVSSKSWAATRRKSSDTPSDLKPKKSIDSFFKPQRTPLAELDPNSFTPSPSQQRLLARHASISSTSPVPPHTPSLHSTVSLPASYRPLISASGNRTSITAKASTSVPHPPKRQRLCEDISPTDETLPPLSSANVEVGRSRFFSSSIQDHSPSIKCTGKNRLKSMTVNIWSDDSIDEVMLGLPDVREDNETRMKGPRIAVYNECQDPEKDIPPTDGILDVKTTQSPQLGSSALTCSAITPSSTTSVISCRVNDSLSTTAKSQARTDRQRFTTLAQDSSNSHVRKQYTFLTNSKMKIPSAKRDDHRPLLNQRKSTTALQRLGNSALTRSHSQSENIVPSISTTPCRADSSVDRAQYDVPQSPDMLVVPVRGSEDLLVANSEDELDGQLKVESFDTPKPKLNLGRFAYDG